MINVSEDSSIETQVAAIQKKDEGATWVELNSRRISFENHP
ncbi:MAG: hypothetical protein ACE5OZ_01685 [Candidatus Heimdallarchaeota archaeon]